jgi:hypothetical protein
MKRFYDAFDREQIKIYLFDEFRKSPAEVVRDLLGFLGVDTGFAPDTTVKHNPANVPRSALLNRVLYQPRVIRAVKAVLPARLEKTAKRLRQRTLSPAPSFPADLRAELLELYREDILRLEELVDRDPRVGSSRCLRGSAVGVLSPGGLRTSTLQHGAHFVVVRDDLLLTASPCLQDVDRDPFADTPRKARTRSKCGVGDEVSYATSMYFSRATRSTVRPAEASARTCADPA